MMASEIWAAITEASKYEISNIGRVRNVNTGRILKQVMIGKTPTVTMMDAGFRLCRSVPKLVREAFGP